MLDRRNFFGATAAVILGLLGWEATAQRHYSHDPRNDYLVMENPQHSGCVMYLDTGDFLQPGEWFAVPKSWVEFTVYPIQK